MRREPFFKNTKEQKKNLRFILSEFSLILGSIFLSQGIVSIFSPLFDKIFFLIVGAISVLVAVLSKRKT